MKKGAVGLASAAVLKDFPSSDLLKSPGKIIERTLGKTGVKLPIVSAGVLQEQSLIKKAYELGVRHFDTALRYYEFDIKLADVIHEMKIRDELFMTTKIPLTLGGKEYIELADYEKYKAENGIDQTHKELKKNILEMCDESIKRLRMDYVDYFALHYVIDPELLDLPPVIEAMTQIKKEGKARFIGISTHMREIPVLNKMVDMKIWDVGLIGIHYKYQRKEDSLKAIKHAADNGIGIIAMKTQGYIREIKGDKTLHTAGLKWVLQNDFITSSIPSCRNYKQLEDNFNCARDLTFTEEESNYLKNYFEKNMGSLIQCEQCEKCLGTCPKNTNIPSLMRSYMYSTTGRDFDYDYAKDVYSRIPENRNLNNCADCTKCTAKCSGGLNIQDNIEQMKVMFRYI
ncbi:aldo/keto reductase [candidate division KSB1 bacterium]